MSAELIISNGLNKYQEKIKIMPFPKCLQISIKDLYNYIKRKFDSEPKKYIKITNFSDLEIIFKFELGSTKT